MSWSMLQGLAPAYPGNTAFEHWSMQVFKPVDTWSRCTKVRTWFQNQSKPHSFVEKIQTLGDFEARPRVPYFPILPIFRPLQNFNGA